MGTEVKPKSINSLMAYMRTVKGISIEGTTQKRKLRNMGYFHGYKGYRFCASPSSLIPYTSFDELQAVYQFDMQLKATLYPQIMFLETTMKNYVLEIFLQEAKSELFATIYGKLLNDYKAYPVGSSKYNDAMKKRLRFRYKVYESLSMDYKKSFIVSHYYEKDSPVPIWAIFELLTLGEFGNLLTCTNIKTRLEISKSFGFNQASDSDGRLAELFVFVLKDLRNSIAHNNIIFDTRFKTHNIQSRVCQYLEAETGVKDINFKTIVDYIILIVYLMKNFKCTKTEIKTFIKQFENVCEEFRNNVPTKIYTRIIHTNTRNKLSALYRSL